MMKILQKKLILQLFCPMLFCPMLFCPSSYFVLKLFCPPAILSAAIVSGAILSTAILSGHHCTVPVYLWVTVSVYVFRNYLFQEKWIVTDRIRIFVFSDIKGQLRWGHHHIGMGYDGTIRKWHWISFR